MTRKRQANIRPDLVGELFTDGESIYRLTDCDREPKATFQDIEHGTPPFIGYVSDCERLGLVQLKPVRPIEKPKKPRADLGGTHKKQASTPSEAPATKSKTKKERGAKPPEDNPEIADKKGDNLTIHVPTGLKGDTEYRVNIAGWEAVAMESVGLKKTVLFALEEFGGNIPDELSEQERVTIQEILDAGE